MLNTMFQPASSMSDWQMPTPIRASSVAPVWSVDDVVILGLSPDYATWDDYGLRRMDTPPLGVFPNGPWWSTSTDADDGVITLLEPNLINIRVPASVMNRMGPGTCNVAVRHANRSTGMTDTLLIGRLPIVYGVA